MRLGGEFYMFIFYISRGNEINLVEVFVIKKIIEVFKIKQWVSYWKMIIESDL